MSQITVQTLYHLTTKDKLPDILKNGLIPQIGTNSSRAGENEIAVFLSSREDMAYWQILTKSDAAVEITKQNIIIDASKRRCGKFDEYRIYQTIAPEFIKEAELPTKAEYDAAMFTLTVNCLSRLSLMCKRLLDLDNSLKNKQVIPKLFASELSKMGKDTKLKLDNMYGVQFNAPPLDKIAKDMWTDSENGYFIFPAIYKDTGKRCWEYLSEIQAPDLKEPALAVQSFIKQNVPQYIRELPYVRQYK